MSKSLWIGSADTAANPFYADDVCSIGLSDWCDLATDTGAQTLHGDASFDYVCCDLSPYRLDSLAAAGGVGRLLTELLRVLRPGGIAMMSFSRGAVSGDARVLKDDVLRYVESASKNADSVAARFHVLIQSGRIARLGLGSTVIALKKVVAEDASFWPRPASRKVSIIVPVYNGAAYLEQTIRSLRAQTHAEFEVLLIDDGSRDESLSILQAAADEDPRFRVFSTGVNLGAAPKVLNFALPKITGSYFVYSSQDDLYSPDWLEKMLARSIETHADAVLPIVTYYYEKEPRRNRSLIGVEGDVQVELTGREAVMRSLAWKIPGNALWNAELVRTMQFSEFAINSDEYSVRRFFNVCNKVAFCDGEFLYRQDNANAITKRINARYLDFPYTHLRLARWLFEQGYSRQAVIKELKSARKMMRAMRRWLARERGSLATEELQEALRRMERNRQMARATHPFGVLPGRFFLL